MLMNQMFRQIIIDVLALLLVVGCTGCATSAPATSPSFPVARPQLAIPDKFELSAPLAVLQNQRVEIDSDVANHLFRDCNVWILADGIRIADSEFVNSTVFVADRSNIVFDRVIFKDLNQYEQAALSINNSWDAVIKNCQFLDNFIGLGVHSGGAKVIDNRFEGNNGHNALVVGEGSAVEVSGNYFYGSFPHAILIMNREGSAQARVDIMRNLIDQTGEDAIDFEDYRNAAPSCVAHNVITNSGWSAVIVEYNSWQSSVVIENNWIEGTGIDWQLATHPLQPDYYHSGWGHGVLVEDSSGVQVMNNRILSAVENGIEIINGRDVLVRGNGIDCCRVGIGVHRYQEASLQRRFSPLAPENAAGSQVLVGENIIYEAQQDYEVDEWSQLVTH